MHKLLLVSALASAAILSAVPALSADLDVMPPPPPPVEELRPATYDWTGVYVGALVGSSCIQGVLTETAGGPPPVTTEWEMSGCGWKGGALVGYNYQIDSMVLGVEADWSRTNKGVVKNEEAGADFQFGLNHEVTMRARVGYAADDTLFFLTGGGAWAQGNLDGIIAAVPGDITGKHWGWSIGGGVEHAFTDAFRMKLDYLYTRYSGASYNEACCNIDIEDFDNHEVRLGAIWAF